MVSKFIENSMLEIWEFFSCCFSCGSVILLVFYVVIVVC